MSAAATADVLPIRRYDDAPLCRFHVRAAVATTAGSFSDGFGLGIIGIALSIATPELALTPVWLGLLGGASLAGLFAGALAAGPVADRFGRRPLYAYNMAALAVLSALQFGVTSPGQLLSLRLAIGFVLGTDYVVGKALLTELAPRAYRGRIVGVLSIAWAAGYASAYGAGFALESIEADAWRWMLLTAAIPCILFLPLRLTIPESPLWLADRGLTDRASAIVLSTLGPRIAPPAPPARLVATQNTWRRLLSREWRRRTAVGCAFFSCQVVPYFAVGTFISRILDALQVADSRIAGLIYNVSLLSGAAIGLVIIDRVPRRTFLVGSFAAGFLALLPLALGRALPAPIVVALFCVFATALSGASNLVFVYLPELFPTELRASGVGIAVATSRVAAALATFLLPIVVIRSGPAMALAVCALVLGVGGLVCYAWAPETRNLSLEGANREAQQVSTTLCDGTRRP